MRGSARLLSGYERQLTDRGVIEHSDQTTRSRTFLPLVKTKHQEYADNRESKQSSSFHWLLNVRTDRNRSTIPMAKQKRKVYHVREEAR
jgi:hypothetical protein